MIIQFSHRKNGRTEALPVGLLVTGTPSGEIIHANSYKLKSSLAGDYFQTEYRVSFDTISLSMFFRIKKRVPGVSLEFPSAKKDSRQLQNYSSARMDYR